MEKRSTTAHRLGFWTVALVFLFAMAFTTVPTPLYLIYQRADGFPTYMITVIFAAYALGVVVSLYLAGHLSDWLGRRGVIFTALAVEAVSALLFLLWHGTTALIVARVLSGLGIGALTATATAHLSELRSVSDPDERGRRASLVATIVNTGGLALGAPIAGLLAQELPAPIITPYAFFLFLLVAGAATIIFVPETVERRKMPAYRPQRLSVAGGQAPLVFAAGTGALAGFAVTGMFGSLAPSLLENTMHESSLIVAGCMTGSVFASATLAQLVFARNERRTQLLVGLLSMTGGLALIAAGVLLGSLLVFLLASMAAGTGTGLILRNSIAVASEVAGRDNRGGVLAVVFLMAYIGLALPVIGLGILFAVVSSGTALLLFASLILLLLLWSGTRMLRSLRPVRV